MLKVFIIAFFLTLMISISLLALNIEKVWNRAKNIKSSPVEYISADFHVYMIITMIFMLPIIPLSVLEINITWLQIIIDSGLAMAITLWVIGFLSQRVYKLIARLGEFRDFENEGFAIYFISCILYIFILGKMKEFTLALTFVAILLGRFVWFDAKRKKIISEFLCFYRNLTVFPLSSCIFFIFTVISVCIEDYTLVGIVFWGHLFALIAFLLCNRRKRKRLHTSSPSHSK